MIRFLYAFRALKLLCAHGKMVYSCVYLCLQLLQVHAFYSGPPPPPGTTSITSTRRMSAGPQPSPSSLRLQQHPQPHYYVHTGTRRVSGRVMPRSGSDQHLPRVEYDYATGTG